MDLFNSDSKNKALKELEMAQKQYESSGRRANRAVQVLYKKRKEAVMAMEPVTIPTKALKPAKSTLATIPITDVRIMATMRLATCSFVSMVKPPQVKEL